MPFFMSANKAQKTDCVSLQVHKPIIENKKNIYYKWKRVCLFASSGSITIEAAISVSMFLMCMLFMESFMLVIHTESSVQMYINNIAQEAAKNAFYIQSAKEMSNNSESLKAIKEKIKREEGIQEQIGDNVKRGVTIGYLKGKLLGDIYGVLSDNSQSLCKMTGISMSESSIESGVIDVVVSYKIRIPYINRYLNIKQRGYIKDWCGIDITEA